MKKILICWMLFLFVIPEFALAHTELEDSTPQDGETVEESVEEIELTFGTEIEAESTVTLTNENGEEIPVSEMVEGSVLTASLEEPLSNGNYTAEWLVVGADGHPIEGEFSFEVANQEETASGGETEESDQTAEEEEVIDEGIDTNGSEEDLQDDNLVNEQVDTEAEDQGISTTLIVVLLIVGAVAIFSGIWLARRKR